MWDEAVGTVLAGYQLEELIGRGGMSAVYRAEHLRLGKKVALKLLSPVLELDEDFRERFVRESRIAASIEHPNIIPIYDAGEADGRLYIAMRHVEGMDLKQIIERDGPLSLARTLYLIEQIASALDAAHARDLVHRDVKPGNILVASGTERVYLTDFGVVKSGASTGLTRTGYFLGTIDYAAPEQIEGRPVDRRTDVYALGCLVYECLTGSPPFQRAGEMAAIHAHLTEEPPRPSLQRSDLPSSVDQVVATAMAKHQEQRYRSAGALAQALRAVALDNVPEGAQRPLQQGMPQATLVSQALAAETPGRPPAAEQQPPAELASAPPPSPPTPPAPPPAAAPPAPGPQPATASAPPPRARRRLGRKAAIVAALLLLAAGGGIAAAVLSLGSSHAASAGSDSMAFPDAIEENLLLAHIPASIRASCERIPPVAVSVFLRSVRCTQAGGQGTVTYSRAHSGEALRSYFLSEAVKAAGVRFPTTSTCAHMQPAADEWVRQGLQTHVEQSSSAAQGRVACWRGPTGATIAWTDTPTKMFAQASRPVGQWTALYAWWRKTAGPETELGTSMSSMGQATTAYPDAIEQELLLDHIPSAIQKTCVRSNDYDATVFLRAVACKARPAGATAEYLYAHAGTAMIQYASNEITAAGLQYPTSSTCAGGGPAADPFDDVGGSGHVETHAHEASGRVLCYVAGGKAVIEWADVPTGVYVKATAPASERRALYLWWRDNSGPNALEMVGMISPTATNAGGGAMQATTMHGTTMAGKTTGGATMRAKTTTGGSMTGTMSSTPG